ncbi:MAG: hypothetical protein WBM90_05820 [Acidimicrobiia bacterium]
MSRGLRVAVSILGGVVIFGVFALAGFAVADRSGSEAPVSAELAIVTLTEYPLQPAQDDRDAQFEYLGAELEKTTLAVESGDATDLGAASVGGQTTRTIIVDTTPEDESTTTVLADDGEGSTGTVPEVVDDSLFPLDELGLVDVIVADPVGPLLIDLCAGPERLPETPFGCPLGFGGSIFTSDETIDPTIQASVFRSIACEASDPERLGLGVRASEPGVLDLTLWPGPQDSEPTPDAFTGTYEVPSDIAAEYVDGEGPLPIFCIDVPAIGGNLVAEHFLTSSYPPRDGVPGPVNRDRIANQSGRPPTAINSSGVSILRVRTISSEEETVWVKARQVGFDLDVESACNTAGASTSGGPRGPFPGGESEADVVAAPAPGYPHPTNPFPDDWPYDPQYNVYTIYQMDLEPASIYAICTYFVGPFDAIVQSEAALVNTPGSHGVEVHVAGVAGNGVEPETEVLGHEVVIQGCGTTSIAYPGPRAVIQHDYSCSIGTLSRLVNEEGFRVTTRTASLEGEDVYTEAWVRVDPDDVLCVTTCETTSTWVTAIPIEGFDPTPSGRRNGHIATLQLEVVFTPNQNGWSDWYLGSSDVFDNNNPELPPNPRVAVAILEIFQNQVGNSADATVSLDVSADRPVALSLEVDPEYPTCPADPGTTPVTRYEGVLGRVTLTGLCFGVDYPITIDAIAPGGESTRVVQVVRTVNGSVMNIRASIRLEPLPSIGGQWRQRFNGVQVGHSGAMPSGYGHFDSLPLTPVLSGGGPGGGWVTAPGNVICDGGTIPPAPREWSLNGVPLRSFGYIVQSSVTRERYFTSSGLGSCEPNRNNPDAPLNVSVDEVIRWNARDLTVQQLLDGVDITTPTRYGTATLTLHAELDPFRR